MGSIRKQIKMIRAIYLGPVLVRTSTDVNYNMFENALQ